MPLEFPKNPSHNVVESENLLNDSSYQNEQIFHEMEMSEGLRVETKDTEGCISLSGSTKYILAAVVASLGGVLFGYDLGIVSGALLQLKREFNLDCQQQEMVVSSMLFGALLGSLAGGYIIDYLGRRRTIIINAFIFFTGAIILAVSPSYALLIVGRLIVGFGTSLSAIAECIYIAEIAPPKRRGLLVSLNEIGIVSGLLLAYLVNHSLINVHNGWRYMFGLSGIPALIQGYGIIFLPPSPRWLICQGRDSQALKVMRSLNLGGSPEEEMSKIKDSLDLEHSFNLCYLFSHHQNMRDRMIVGFGLVFFQQFTGQPSVLYYAPSIFENIGFHSHSAATLATVGIGFTKLVATVITLCLVDKAGRRRFLLCGSILMTISIALLYTVTQSSPGAYHKELCTNNATTLHKPPPTNLPLLPSFSPHDTLNTNTCTPILIYISQSNSPMITTQAPQHPTIQPTKTSYLSHSTTTGDYKTEVKLVCPSYPPPITNMKGNSTELQTNSSSSRSKEISAVVKYVAVLSLMVFAGAYSCSYGPVSWLVLSEIFPTEIKGRAFAVTTVLNWGSNLIVSLTMLDLIDSVGVSWTFFIYGGIGVLAIIFIYKIIPETKNRSLEEINALFSTRNPFSTRSCCGERYSSISSHNAQDTGLLQEDEWKI